MTEQSPNASEANTGDVIQLQATVEYRVNKASKSEMRKCLRCDILVKSPNGGTTGLLKHRSACSKKIPKRKVDRGQLSLGFAKTQKLALAKGFKLITQLVYKDQTPLNTVTKSEALQHILQTLNYGSVTYYSVNKALNASYHSIIAKIKELIANRDKDQQLASKEGCTVFTCKNVEYVAISKGCF